jgi:Bacterial SH3 domain
MRQIITMLFFIAAAIPATAQTLTRYAAVKTGISIRENPDAKAKVLDKIAYGEKLAADFYSDSIVYINTEGIPGTWVKITYKGKKGYVVSSYLFPFPPPKQGVTTLKGYLAQLSPVSGAAVTRKGTERMGESEFNTTLTKQLYKNGAELHSFFAYEYNSDSYFLPEFGIEQGFLLLRLLGEFPDAIAPGEAMPVGKGVKKSKAGTECSYEIEKAAYGIPANPVLKLKYEWQEGASYVLSFMLMDGQLVITASGGV